MWRLPGAAAPMMTAVVFHAVASNPLSSVGLIATLEVATDTTMPMHSGGCASGIFPLSATRTAFGE